MRYEIEGLGTDIPIGPMIDHMVNCLIGLRSTGLSHLDGAVILTVAREARPYQIGEIMESTAFADPPVRKRLGEMAEMGLMIEDRSGPCSWQITGKGLALARRIIGLKEVKA